METAGSRTNAQKTATVSHCSPTGLPQASSLSPQRKIAPPCLPPKPQPKEARPTANQASGLLVWASRRRQLASTLDSLAAAPSALLKP